MIDTALGVEETDQSVKCLLPKQGHEFDAQHLHKSWVWQYICNPTVKEVEGGGSLGLRGQPA